MAIAILSKLKLFNQAFEALKKNIILIVQNLGHSNSVIYTAFISFGDYDIVSDPRHQTPYNFTETNINNKSEMLAGVYQRQKAIKTTLPYVFSRDHHL